jgi:hypothetical protein
VASSFDPTFEVPATAGSAPEGGSLPFPSAPPPQGPPSPGGPADLPPELLAMLAQGGGLPMPPPDMPPASGLPAAPPGPPGLPPDMPPGMGPEGFGPTPGNPDLDSATVGMDDRPTMVEVNYRWGDCCAGCAHYQSPESCMLVNGHIRPDGICDKFLAIPGLPEDAAEGAPY